MDDIGVEVDLEGHCDDDRSVDQGAVGAHIACEAVLGEGAVEIHEAGHKDDEAVQNRFKQSPEVLAPVEVVFF